MSTWPASLPEYVLQQGYDENLAQTSITSKMDTGRRKKRRRFTAGISTLTVSILMTNDQVETFKTFYETTCAGGTLPFDWKHPRTQEDVEFSFAGDEAPKIKAAQGPVDFIVSFALEILP